MDQNERLFIINKPNIKDQYALTEADIEIHEDPESQILLRRVVDEMHEKKKYEKFVKLVLPIQLMLDNQDALSEPTVLALLGELMKMDMTVKALAGTDIARRVNDLKKHKLPEIRERATQLSRKWKAIIDVWVESNFDNAVNSSGNEDSRLNSDWEKNDSDNAVNSSGNEDSGLNSEDSRINSDWVKSDSDNAVISSKSLNEESQPSSIGTSKYNEESQPSSIGTSKSSKSDGRRRLSHRQKSYLEVTYSSGERFSEDDYAPKNYDKNLFSRKRKSSSEANYEMFGGRLLFDDDYGNG